MGSRGVEPKSHPRSPERITDDPEVICGGAHSRGVKMTLPDFTVQGTHH